MIRRGFWLVLGAAAGVTVYRRVSRLARSLAAPGRGGEPAVGVAAREPLLSGRRALAGAARAGRSAGQSAAFVRDVRDGMAEYVDRQAQAGRTLESRTDDNQRGRRAPGG